MHPDCQLKKKDALRAIKNINRNKYQVFFRKVVNKIKIFL